PPPLSTHFPYTTLFRSHVHLGARGRLHAADVDDVGALGDHLVDPLQRLLPGEGRAAVVEGVGGAVDDRHHERLVAELAVAQPQHRTTAGSTGSLTHGLAPPLGTRSCLPAVSRSRVREPHLHPLLPALGALFAL